MKNIRTLRLAATLALLAAPASFAFADGAADVARAAALVQRMVELNQKFAAYDIDLPAPDAIQGVTGKYLLPVNADGSLTGWAQKALTAQVGNIAGEQAGAAAGKGLSSMVPGGGLASGFLKKKGKEAGAMAALGGPKYIKETSSLSFDTVEDYAIYLHAKAGKSADYSKAVQAAIALYPDLEKSYTASVTAAYEAAKSAAAAKQAALAAQAAADAAAAAPTAPATPTVTVTAPAVTVTVTPAATDASTATPTTTVTPTPGLTIEVK